LRRCPRSTRRLLGQFAIEEPRRNGTIIGCQMLLPGIDNCWTESETAGGGLKRINQAVQSKFAIELKWELGSQSRFM
jgi:hypothetical protein